MTEQEIFDTLKELVVDQLGVDPEKIKMEATFEEDLEADSLDIVELLMEIEEKFEIKVPDEDAENMKSVADVVAFIKNARND